MTWIMYESCFWKSNIENAETVATYEIIIFQESVEFFWYKHKPLGECVY